MRMIVVPTLGGPEVLTLAEGDKPAINADQVLVKLKYATITYGDVYLREGTYRGGAPLKPGEGPLRIGGEGSGTVEAVGANVKHVNAGDQVIYEAPGSYAEYVAAPGARVVKVPDGISLQ